MSGLRNDARRLRGRRAALLAAATAAGLCSLALVPLAGQAATPTPPGFSHSTVDANLAGGEPFVTFATIPGGGSDLVYTSHEGTTHLFRDGLIQPDHSTVCSTPTVPPQTTPKGFLCSYKNQVNVWTSTNHGASWTQTTVGPATTGPTSPYGLGFSDPDLTADEGGWIYNTGIDLANDSVFASHDGGKTFPVGNNQCHEGDRPWLAGGISGEVFLATDTQQDLNTQLSSGHEIFHGTITGTGPTQTLACTGADGAADPAGTSTGILDYGTSSAPAGGSYGAVGKLFYDHNNQGDGYHGALIEPAIFSKSSDAAGGGVGISVLKDAAGAFGATAGSHTFKQFEVPGTTSVFAHWPAIALASNDVVYLVWDTNETSSTGLDNAILLSTIDLKAANPVFTTPITITRPGASVLWPWVAVGNPGNVSVVWYQYDGVTNPDGGSGKVSLYESSVFGAGGATPTVLQPVDAVGSSIHTGGMCQTGTLCVATGQDRRLGDFFTNAVDENGCVMIATGETATNPTAATARPIFIQQTNGTSLTGKTCTVPTVTVAEAPLVSVLVLGGGVAALVTVRRRRSRGARSTA